jgi:hypothetical protein
VWTGIVGDCLVGPHVLLHRPTGNHYRDFLLHDLPELLEDVPLELRARIWYMHDGASAHFSCAVRDVSNITYHDPWIGRGGPTAGLHAHRIWILWMFTCGDTLNPLCMQLLLTTKRHFAIALRMPVKLSATCPGSLNGCGGPRWDVSMRALNPMEDILSTYYVNKCTLLAITHTLNVSGHMVKWTYFLVLVCGTRVQNLFVSFS